MKKKILVTLLKYGIAVALLAFVLWQNWHIEAPVKKALPVVGASTVALMGSPLGDGPLLAASALFPGRATENVGVSAVIDKQFHWWPLVLALIVCTFGTAVTFVRWYVLVRALDLPFTLTDAFRLGLLGFFTSSFLPGSVTGDIPKALFLAKEQNRRTAAVATVLFDRVLGLIGLIWLAAIFGIVFLSVVGFQQMDRVIYIVYGTIGLFAGTVIAWIILGFIPANQSGRLIERAAQIPKVGHTLAELLRAGVMYRARGKSVCLALFLAVIGHVAFVSTFYLSSLTLQPADEIPSLGTHFLIVPVGMTIQAGMPTPGGVGGAELAYDWLYELALRWSGPKGVMACILQRCVGWALSLLGYLIYLRMKPAAPTAPTNEQPDHAAPTTCDAVSG